MKRGLIRKVFNETDYIFQRFKDILFTKPCISCGKLMDVFSSEIFCSDCNADVKEKNGFVNDRFYGGCLVAVYSYIGSARKAVHNFKFKSDSRCGIYLSEEMIKVIEKSPEYQNIDLVVYVPCYKLKAGRKFNTAEFLAKRISKSLGVTLGEGVIFKARDSASQTKQKNIADRFGNVKEVYKIRRELKDSVKGKKVLLIDDICTTGATLSECFGALFSAGAFSVCAAVAARTDKGRIIFKKYIYPNASYIKETRAPVKFKNIKNIIPQRVASPAVKKIRYTLALMSDSGEKSS